MWKSYFSGQKMWKVTTSKKKKHWLWCNKVMASFHHHIVRFLLQDLWTFSLKDLSFSNSNGIYHMCFFLGLGLVVFYFFQFCDFSILEFFSFFGHFPRISTKKTTNFKFSKCFFNHSAKICQKQFHWFLHSQSSTRRCSLGYRLAMKVKMY